jgi:uncharacterized protein (DUF1330 family)
MLAGGSSPRREAVMKTHFTVSLAILTGVGIGAVAVQSLHAQSKPPVYFVGENDVSNPDAYAKEFLPLIKETIKASGGRYVAAGKATTLEGEPPASRVVVIAFDSLEKIQAWRDSQAFKDDRKIGDKYAKFRGRAPYEIRSSEAILGPDFLPIPSRAC